MKKTSLFLFALVLLLASCYYDSEETLYPDVDKFCDTSNVTYSGSIEPIMSQSCTGCHGADAAGGYDFRTYESVRDNIDIIISCISYENGYSPMPQNSNQLDSCKIKQFISWRQLGTPNN